MGQENDNEPVGGGQAAAAPPQIDWEADDNPYKKRFTDYRSEADRRATEYRQAQQTLEDLQSDDPERRRAAAEALGFDLEEPPVEDDDALLQQTAAQNDPRVDELLRKQQELESKLTEREQAERERELASTISARLEGMNLSEEDGDWVLARAIALPPKEDGLPDLEAAHQMLVERDNKVLEAWRKGKRAPASIGPGQSATEQKNIADMTDNERIEWAVARAAELEQQA